MYARRLLLAAVVVPAFTLSAQPQGAASASGAKTAARPGSARLDQARARSASIDDRRVDVTPANLSGVLDRLRTAVSLGVLDTEAGAADDLSLVAGRISPYPMPWGIARAVYAESGRTVYPAKRAIEKPAALPAWQLTVRSGSACWWLWVFTGTPVCQ
jgi:hypothetical protein